MDLVNFPLNVAQGHRWADAALLKVSLVAADKAFVLDCQAKLKVTPKPTWQPTAAEWNRLMALAQ